MRIGVDEHGRVDASVTLHLPMSAATVWGQLRDWRRTLTVDPLHARVEAVDASRDAYPPQGMHIRIVHRLLGVQVTRRGRVCWWREGVGFSVSDLSMRGGRVGFPHVCGYRVRPIGDGTCELTVSARGKWTATWMPRWLVRTWLWWVMASTRGHLERHFDKLLAWRRGRGLR